MTWYLALRPYLVDTREVVPRADARPQMLACPISAPPTPSSSPNPNYIDLSTYNLS